MNDKKAAEQRQINYLATETDALYHQASLKLGIPDSMAMVLYALYNSGGRCKVSDIYKVTGVSRQTVASAIRMLETAGILCLERYDGKAKLAVLTEKGEAYVQKTAARIFQAELQALSSWTEDEVSTYIRLMKKYVDCLRQQIELL